MLKGLQIGNLSQTDLKSAYQVFETTIPDTYNKEGLGSRKKDIMNEIYFKKQLLDSSLTQDGPEIYFLLAKLNENVIGTISFGPCGEDIKKCTERQLNNVGEIGSLFILPPYQGQGVGSALLSTMVMQLDKQGIDQFCLDSGYKNAQKRWLRKFGEPYKVVKDYWGLNYDHMIWLCNVKSYLLPGVPKSNR
ncbi:acetyltransferase, N-acetylglutamate synthase [Desulfosporosinus acidiphilus SJ4]|uniref:Acetyltransferase, N-acetylglutamate synthase n=1 Tax=Desulfosporosinus acidiphilus (strain DSM 22704 / JCM 16185 / SJ4) TaxID=646529 RepID=I4D3Z8_DESAJ|nr:GNAT family N-acetyltransferase [Desulfosporosinus acidiphilus]AFM40522.1 acetyltransferase, N-acetylglutamate synthase [Desulfosporosinus acidiphilus SJ4]